MAPRTHQQYENIREEKRSLIMSAALELFAEKGYHNTSIRNIALKAGISKGLMYNYFESKEELIRVIIIHGLVMLQQMIDPDGDGIITKDEMRLFIEMLFEMMKRDQHFWTLYFALMVQPIVIDLVNEKLSETLLAYQELLIKYFKSQGYKDPESEAVIFGALMDGIGLNIIARTITFPIDKVKERLIKIYCT